MTADADAPLPGTGKLSGRVAVVTGASGGIGRAIAVRLAREGAAVVATGRNEAALEETAAAAAESIVRPLIADITVPVAIESIVPYTLREFGSVPHILVSCAGVQTFGDLFDLPIEEWDHVFDVNARGTFMTLRHVSEAMKSVGRGSIVNVASIQARLGNRYFAHYSASKAAVLSLTKSFAVTLATQGVRVNAVAPGIIDAGLAKTADRELARIRGLPPGEPMRQRVAQIPLGRAGTPDEVASAVTFLASDDASYITGECIHVCGGDLMI